ncbi:MAG: VUT family protein [Actinomycetota bacterium]|nr:VUT family protein [Actinomycetota bacterium]
MNARRLAVLTGLYVAVVCTAQVTANKIVVIPWTNLSIPGGTYLIGVALALIELAHYTAPTRREGGINAQVMILMGFVASALLAAYITLIVHSKPAFPGQGFDAVLGPTWRIVLASLGAFIVSETIDNVLGFWARGRVPDAVRVVGTNAVSAPLDSFVFLLAAFGNLSSFGGQYLAKMAATVIVGLPLVLASRRVVAGSGA